MNLWRRFGAWRRRLALGLAAVLLAGCASTEAGLGYYWQSVTGHWQLMRSARPVADWLADEHTPPALRQKLATARDIRRFAVAELALPDNRSYTRYADLGRRAAVFNVVAAPALSLQLRQWCFPVAGCVGYRGYYDEAAAQAFAASLPADMDVAVYPVQAYSTLGWLDWLGGDPLLNTFIGYPDGELARLVFHELAHQVVYVAGDMAFNESFATAVERLGGERWLSRQAGPDTRAAYDQFDGRRQAFRALTLRARGQLAAVYANKALSETGQHARKAEVMADFRRSYGALKAEWGGYAGYDAWVAQANNALFGAQAAYDQWVPAFEALFAREGRDFARFYAAVKALAAEPEAQRRAALQVLMPTSPPDQAGGDGALPR